MITARQLKVSDLAAVRLLWLFMLGFASGVAQRDQPSRKNFYQRAYDDAPEDRGPIDFAAVYTEAVRLDVLTRWYRFAEEQSHGSFPWGGPDCEAAIFAFVFQSGVVAAAAEGDELAAVTPPRAVGAGRLHEIWDRMPSGYRGRWVNVARRVERTILGLVLLEPDARAPRSSSPDAETTLAP